MRAAVLALAISVTQAFANCAEAQDRVLVGSDRLPVRGYRDQVASIADGDRLIYPGNVAIRVGRKLGCGGTTCVYEVSEPAWWKGKAVRVPMDEEALSHVGYFISGEPALREHGVPSVAIHAARSDQFVIVEKIESRMTLERLFRDPFAVPEAERRHLVAELKRFAVRTRDFERISDFRPDQLHFVDRRGWILVDWNDHHQLRAPGGSGGDAFEPVFKAWVGFWGQDPKKAEWLRSLQGEIHHAIAAARSGGGIEHSVSGCEAGFLGIK